MNPCNGTSCLSGRVNNVCVVLFLIQDSDIDNGYSYPMKRITFLRTKVRLNDSAAYLCFVFLKVYNGIKYDAEHTRTDWNEERRNIKSYQVDSYEMKNQTLEAHISAYVSWWGRSLPRSDNPQLISWEWSATSGLKQGPASAAAVGDLGQWAQAWPSV